MDQPPPMTNRLVYGPFSVYATGDLALPPNLVSLLALIAHYYYSPVMRQLLASMPSRKRTGPSLRAIEWLLTIESFNNPIYTEGINLHGLYRSASDVLGHTKETFDPNRRQVGKRSYRIWFDLEVDGKIQILYSTVAAAHFLTFCVQNGIMQYAITHHVQISKRMIEAVNNRKAERQASAKKGIKATRKTFRNIVKR